jgi:hypothetical protein
MWAFISLLPDWIKLPSAAALGALVVSPGVFLYGKHEGRQAAAVAAIGNSVRVLRERDRTDEAISSSQLAGLCQFFGLSDDDQRECLRRLEEANAKP